MKNQLVMIIKHVDGTQSYLSDSYPALRKHLSTVDEHHAYRFNRAQDIPAVAKAMGVTSYQSQQVETTEKYVMVVYGNRTQAYFNDATIPQFVQKINDARIYGSRDAVNIAAKHFGIGKYDAVLLNI